MTLFDWLEEITVKKTPSANFTEESWDSFNSYMVHRYLSMDINYVELVNYVQKINPIERDILKTSVIDTLKQVWRDLESDDLDYVKKKL